MGMAVSMETLSKYQTVMVPAEELPPDSSAAAVSSVRSPDEGLGAAGEQAAAKMARAVITDTIATSFDFLNN